MVQFIELIHVWNTVYVMKNLLLLIFIECENLSDH